MIMLISNSTHKAVVKLTKLVGLSEENLFGAQVEALIVQDLREGTPLLFVVGVTQSEPDLEDLLHTFIVISIVDPGVNLNLVFLKEFNASALSVLGQLESLSVELVLVCIRA